MLKDDLKKDDLKDEDRAHCIICGNAMLLVTSVPCSVNPHIDKRTFVCVSCNKIKTYALANKMPVPRST